MDLIYDLKENLLANYDKTNDRDGISGERISERLSHLSKIGRTSSNGSNRPGYSQEEKAAKELIASWMREAGLDVRFDGGGNVIGRLAGKNPELPAIVSGSHVDSVPNGGHFDGPLGVMLALEVVDAWKSSGYVPEKPYEVVIFADEEGACFNGGLNGSEAFTGDVNMVEKLRLTDSIGRSFEEVLKDVGLTVEGYETTSREQEEIEMYVEVHIEQGKRLEKENLPCGIVTGIAGAQWIAFTFTGEASHAGNTPMTDRRDPMLAVSDFMLAINKLPGKYNDSAVVTVGKLNVKPNGVNVIPSSVELFVDLRDIYQDTRDEIALQVKEAAKQAGEKFNIDVVYEELMDTIPVPIAKELQEKLAETLEELDVEPYYLPSGAGHDAMILGQKWPVAMLFVQSKAGISHNPAEWTELADAVMAARALKKFIEKMQ